MRARIKNYMGWEFLLHINQPIYRPVPTVHMTIWAELESNWDSVEVN